MEPATPEPAGSDPLITGSAPNPDSGGPDSGGGVRVEDGGVAPEKTISLSGRVSTTSGLSLPGATLTVVDCDGAQVATARSGKDARYSIEGIPGGCYAVVAILAPHLPLARLLSVGGGRAVMEMALTGRGSIAGRVLESSLAGTAAAAPLPSVPIRLCRSGGPTVATAFSGPDGQFRFDELDEGTWELLAEHVRYSPAKEAVTVVAGSESSCDLVLMGVGDIRGSVVSPGGVPLPAMAIFLVANDGEVIAKERSDALGAFHFSGVPTGDHVLLAIDVEPGAEPVKVAAGDVAHCDVQVRRNPPVQAVAK